VRAIEPDTARFPVDRYLGATPIAELSRAFDLYLVRPVDAAYSLKGVSHKTDLRFKLRLVGKMLELASTAVPEIPAKRLASEGRSLKHLFYQGSREAFLLFSDSNPQPLVGRGEGNEHGETVVSSNGFTAVSEPLGRDFNYIANAERGVLHKFNITGERCAKEVDER
jgi:hypothetical protein